MLRGGFFRQADETDIFDVNNRSLIFFCVPPQVHAAVDKWDQTHFRFRNDDGLESAATWKDAEDTDVTDISKNMNFRLRLQTTNIAVTSNAVAARIEYKLSAGGACANASGWTVITTSTANAFALSLSSFFANAAVTTVQLTNFDGFIAGSINETSNPAASVSPGVSISTEHERSMQATSNAADNTA